ncbi:hypothetical protein LCGC14_1714080 [marine sediment metagenome]|uniref:Phage terminase large subunit N-terminal domain-containing protein n=1 Tax=marine sediment metagenome TaxID=412755 RepID=A0A0F9J7L8_9ZZZZ
MRDINQTKVFTELWNTADQYKIHLLRGGARSSKSYSLMQMVFLWLMTGRIGAIKQPSGIFAIVRNVLPALKDTVLRDFINYLTEMGVADYVDHLKTRNTFEYNNRVVTFFPATDESRLKGRQNDFVWINEANDLSWYEFQQLIMRTGGCLWCDYNPDNPDSWVKTELEEKRLEKRKDVNLMISTVLMNPFLSDSQREEINNLADYDNELYEVYTLGNWVKFKGLIFPNWDIIESKDFPSNALKQCYAMDIGYNDATVLLHVVLQDKTLFIDEVFHETGLTTADVIKLLDESPVRNSRIIADAQAKSFIEEIKRRKYRIRPCKKGPDSLLNGIKKVKSLKLKITDRSLKTMQELKRFKWKKDKNGDDTDEPLNRYKNAPDAIRYGAMYLTKTNTIRMI